MATRVPPWDPLPPRATTSSRQQRRQARARTFATSSNTDNASDVTINDEGRPKTDKSSNHQTSTQPSVPKRRPYRPGFNSYLKVMLDETTMDRMHRIAQNIQTKIQSIQLSKTNDIDNDTADGKSSRSCKKDDNSDKNKSHRQKAARKSKSKSRRALRFKPKSRNSLHLTLFFGGEILSALPGHELQEWHETVRERLHRANFLLKSSPASAASEKMDCSNIVKTESMTHKDDDYWFRVTSLSMFPPKRNNLVVAILEASPAWHNLHRDIQDIATNGESQALREIAARSKDKWIAHITLGEIIMGGGSKSEVRQSFDQVLKDVCDDLEQQGNISTVTEDDILPAGATRSRCLLQATTVGIAMGGPVPDQVDLDWNFQYQPPNND